MKKGILFSIIYLMATICNAVEEQTSLQFTSTDISQYTGAIISLQDPEAADLLAGTNTFTDVNRLATLSLIVDLDDLTMLDSYEVEMELDVEYTNHLSTVAFDQSQSITLSVSYAPTSATWNASYKNEDLYYLRNAYALRFEITSILITIGNNTYTTFADIPSNVSLNIDLTRDRYYPFDHDNAVSLAQPAISYHTQTNEMEVEWLAEDGAEYYDFEWTYVNDYAEEDEGDIAFLNPDYSFINNSTRVQLKSTSYRIPLVYDHGWIVFRVRANGYSELFNQMIPGKWSLINANGNITTVGANSRYHIVDAHENLLNWQIGFTFAEEGKRKLVASYFDGSSRNRQTIATNNADNTIIAGESIYDHLGRAAIQVLPVPTTESAVHYISGFNYAPDGTEYSREHFDYIDLNECYSSALPMISTFGENTVQGAELYYSSDNPDLNSQDENLLQQATHIPSANGFPFVQTVFTPDNTGRVRAQSGVGDMHTISSGHETKYYYSSPFQEELDRLFGAEVGYAEHYQKNVTLDPNGQLSTNYVDMYGRTVATSLAGGGSENLEQLNSVDDYALDVDLFNEDENGFSLSNSPNIQGESIVFTKYYTAIQEGPHTFYYQVEAPSFDATCVCADCIYELNISIKNECGEEMIVDEINQVYGPISELIGDNFETPDLTCASPAYSFGSLENAYFEIVLPVGTYQIVKTLHINQDAASYYLAAYLDDPEGNCLSTLPDFIDDAMNDLELSDCGLDCESCLNLVNATFTLGAWMEAGGIELEFAAALEDALNSCNEMCVEEASVCIQTRNMMLADLRPGGQYATYTTVIEDGEQVFSAADDQLSIFNDNNQLPNVDASWRTPVYYLEETTTPEFIQIVEFDGDHFPALIPQAELFSGQQIIDLYPDFYSENEINPEGLYAYPNELENFSDFMMRYNSRDYWAFQLLEYHPEYCYFEWCLANTTPQSEVIFANEPSVEMSSDSFDALVLQTNLDLVDLPDAYEYFGAALEIWNYDPFITLDLQLATDFEDRVLNYITIGGNDLSMYQYANLLSSDDGCLNMYGADWATDIYNDCFNPGLDNEDYITNQTIWETFRSLYISLKQEIQYASMDQYVGSDCTFGYGTNACIGAEPGEYAYQINLESAEWSCTGWEYIFNPADCFPPFLIYDAGEGEACGYYTFNLYADKVQRFVHASDLLDDIANLEELIEEVALQTQYDYYLQTGQCPLASDMSALIQKILLTQDLQSLNNTTISLQQHPEFSSGLYNAFNPNANSYSEFTSTFTYSAGNRRLNFEINGAGNINPCTSSPEIWIEIPDVFGYTWLSSELELITGIQNFHYVDYQSYNFEFLLLVSTLDPENPILEIPIIGSTCIDINDCESDFANEEVCEGNSKAEIFASLMTLLALDVDQNDLPYIFQSIDFSTYDLGPMEDVITANFGTPISWSHTASSSFTLITSTYTTGITVSIVPSLDLTDVAFFQSLEPADGGGFEIDVIYQDQSHEFNKTVNVSVNGTPNQIFFGECAGLIPSECQNDEYQNLTDLVNFIKSLHQGQILTSDTPELVNGLTGFTSNIVPGPIWDEDGVLVEYYWRAILVTDGSLIGELGYVDTQGFHSLCTLNLNMTIEEGNWEASWIIQPQSSWAGTEVEEGGLVHTMHCIVVHNTFEFTLSINSTCHSFANCDDCPPPLQDALFEPWSASGGIPNSNGCQSVYLDIVDYLQNQTNIHWGIEGGNLTGSECLILPTELDFCLNYASYAGFADNFVTYLQNMESIFWANAPDDFSDCSDGSPLLLSPESYSSIGVDYTPACIEPYLEYLELPEVLANPEFFEITLIDFCQNTGQLYLDDGAPNHYFMSYLPFMLNILGEIGITGDDVYNYIASPLQYATYAQCVYKTNADIQCQNAYFQYAFAYADENSGTGEMEDFILFSDFCTCVNPSDDCEPELPVGVSPVIEVENDCLSYLEGIFIANAQTAFDQYIEDVSAEFINSYYETCLQADEDFRLNIPSSEHHYTLYYYDQAGNLIRTIPPAGVRFVDIDNVTIQEQIDSDRANNTQFFFTEHRMATDYIYNSLNQLVAQSTPDTDDFNIYNSQIETEGIPEDVTIESVEFINLVDGILFATDPNGDGLIFTTSDGGENWNPLSATGIENLNRILVDGNNIFVAGNNGTVLFSDDDGETWISRPLPTLQNVVSIVLDNQYIIAFTSDGGAFSSNDQGVSWAENGAVIDILNTGELVTDVIHDGAFYATTNEGRILFIGQNGWGSQDITLVGINGGNFTTSSGFILGGPDGTIVEQFGNDFKEVTFPAFGGNEVNIIETCVYNDKEIVLDDAGNLYQFDNNEWDLIKEDVFDIQLSYSDAELIILAEETGHKLFLFSNNQLSNPLQVGANHTKICVPYDSNYDYFWTYGGDTGARRFDLGNWTIAPNHISSIDVYADLAMIWDEGNDEGIAWALISTNLYEIDFDNTAAPDFGPSPLLADILSIDAYGDYLMGISADDIVYSNGINSQVLEPLDINSFENHGIIAGPDQAVVFSDDGNFVKISIDPFVLPTLLTYAQTPPLKHLHKLGNDIVAVGEDGTIVSKTSGTGFRVNPSGVSNDILTVNANTIDRFAVGDDSGKILVSNDITSMDWGTPIDASTMPITALDVDDSNDIIFAHGSSTFEFDLLTYNNNVYTPSEELVLSSSSRMNDLKIIGEIPILAAIAVGDNSEIHKIEFDGQDWTGVAQNTFIAPAMYAAEMVDNNFGIAVGEAGTVLITNDAGVTWQVDNSLVTTETLIDVAFASSEFGAILSESWNLWIFESEEFSDPPINVVGLAAIDAYGDEIVAVGTDLFWSYSEGSMSLQDSPNLNAVSMVGSTLAFACGNDGAIHKFINNGGNWTEMELVHPDLHIDWVAALDNGTTADLNDIHFVNYTTGYVVGDGGIILKTNNGGVTWELLDNNLDEDILNITFLNNYNAFLGGTNGFAYLLQDFTDQFSSRFYYDQLGRIIASQSSRQYLSDPKRYSYSLYDALGRVTEAGQIDANYAIETLYNDGIIEIDQFSLWINAVPYTNRTEITHSHYDRSDILIAGFDAQNLRNRVSAITYEDVMDGDFDSYDHASLYSYDILGNVKTLVQHMPAMNDDGYAKHFVEYEYDLVSGNVNKVIINRKRRDQFFHRYTYDAENRLIASASSINDIIYTTDAKYNYYKHGPLSRLELGNEVVQGLDYAYSIHGWLKGVNTAGLNASDDIGIDGLENSFRELVPVDAFGFALSYYDSDYSSIATSSFLPDLDAASLSAVAPDLYNGNIRAMATGINFNTQNVENLNTMAYSYDQLNRIKSANAFSWESNAWSAIDAFNEEYSYDANGNILSLSRDGGTAQLAEMDNFTYIYENESNGFEQDRNRLLAVQDAANTSAQVWDGVDDLKPGQVYDFVGQEFNYSYDAAGNLISDKQEEIANIEWTVSGKVRSITREDGSTKADLEFHYDALGNRILKIVKPRDANGILAETEWEKTWYLRDAQSNVLQVYDLESYIKNEGYGEELRISEQHLYGSGRLGIRRAAVAEEDNEDDLLYKGLFTASIDPIEGNFFNKIYTSNNILTLYPNKAWDRRGQKQYEMSNHLGNVLCTVSDRRSGILDGLAIAAYESEILSASDYYPFGMQMPGRSYSSGDYRFGFNGMERVDEISGVGNHYTAEYWEMDPRVLRRWNTDPVVKHWESPYAIFHNNPIFFTDPQGDDPPEKTKKHKIEKGETLSGIAKKTGASVDDLMNWNKGSIKDKDKIFEGDEINISDPKRWTLDEGSWIDSQNPDELWASTGDGGWTNINAQTFGEWFGETWNQPVGYISDDGEMTIGKNSEAAEAMMQIVPPMISWGATVYANPRLPKVSGSSGFQHLGSWQKGGNFGHFSSYNGAGFSFKTSHSFYRAHASGSFSSTKLTIRQVESSIARNAYHNIHKIPKAGNGYFPGSVNIDGVNVGYRAVMNRGSVEITTYFPKLH
jgi:photosystem II stability/assembly factor-like uncharacterized protein